jgi:hypothetical protein
MRLQHPAPLALRAVTDDGVRIDLTIDPSTREAELSVEDEGVAGIPIRVRFTRAELRHWIARVLALSQDADLGSGPRAGACARPEDPAAPEAPEGSLTPAEAD